MKNHPGKKQLIDSVIGFSKDKESAEIAFHLDTCEECRATVESLGIILKASDNDSLVPSEKVKEQLSFLLDDLEKKDKSSSVFQKLIPVFKTIIRPAVFASVLLIIVAFFFIYNMQQSRIVHKEVTLTLSRHNGTQFYNDTVLQKDSLQITSGIIKTEEYSSAELSLESLFSLKIAENTDLSLVNAFEDMDKEIKTYNISLDMGKGNIMVMSGSNIKKSFMISTPQAVFKTIGTSFILSSDNLASSLSVLDGMVQVTSKGKREIMVLNKEEGCTIKGSLMKTSIIPENEIKKFDSIFNKFRYQNTLRKNNGILRNNSIKDESSSQDKENENSPAHGNVTIQEKEKAAKEAEKYKDEFQKDSKQIQRELRKNRGSGKQAKP